MRISDWSSDVCSSDLVEAHDLAELVATLPDLRMIAFNGGKAAAIGRRQLPVPEGMAFIDLPSSSAAHTIGFDAKLERWMKLRGALVVPSGSPHPFVLSLSKDRKSVV